MDGDDGSRYPAGFRIPAHMIADLESFRHLVSSLFFELRGRPRFQSQRIPCPIRLVKP
jgi:hypothetical protein